MAIITDKKDIKDSEEIKDIKEEIIPRDEQKQIILGLIEGVKKEIFNNSIMERYFARKAIIQPSYQKQLGNVQGAVKESGEYLKFLEELLKEDY